MDVERHHEAGRGPSMSVVVGVAAAAVVVAIGAWSLAPDYPGNVPEPGPDATPEDVVRTYFEAVEKRDHVTADAIDGRGDAQDDRAGDFLEAHDLRILTTVPDANGQLVLFDARFSGGNGTVEDGTWGFLLARGDNGTWHIVDEGVS